MSSRDAVARTQHLDHVAPSQNIDADLTHRIRARLCVGQGGVRMKPYELVTGHRFWELNLGGQFPCWPSLSSECFTLNLMMPACWRKSARSSGRVGPLDTELQLIATKKDQRRGRFSGPGPVLRGPAICGGRQLAGEVWKISAGEGSGTCFDDIGTSRVACAWWWPTQYLYILEDNGTIHAWR